jgi:hypothetical protein
MKKAIGVATAVTVAVLWSFARPQASVDVATELLSALAPEKRARLIMPFDSASRDGWAYTPGIRAGIAFRDLDEAEQRKALALLRSALSESGYEKVEAIRTKVEPALRDLEGNPQRDLGLYYYTFWGEPTAKGRWGWRYEGHHLSLNFTYSDGRIVSTTPQFLGSNPAEVRSGPNKGTRVLAKEEEWARELARSLNEAQRAKAILSNRAPADLLTSNQRRAQIQANAGIAFAELNESQRNSLRKLVELYAEVQSPIQQKARMAKVEKGGWDRLKFAWMGGLEPGQGHYYRVQGPTFLIEYDNTQNGANHVHCVWRDFEGDFGRDMLGEHYRTSSHHRPAPLHQK